MTPPDLFSSRERRRRTPSGLALLARNTDAGAAAMVARLQTAAPEFRVLWDEHLVGKPPIGRKRVMHPELGEVRFDCQTLFAENETQHLLAYTAQPGSEDAEKLRLLDAIGSQRFARAEG